MKNIYLVDDEMRPCHVAADSFERALICWREWCGVVPGSGVEPTKSVTNITATNWVLIDDPEGADG